MKKILLSFFAVLSFSAFSQNVAINGTGAPPVASAMLDITSVTSGLLIPRMTSVQRAAIAGPAQGLYVFDLTTNSFWFFNGVIWVEVTSSTTGWLLAGNTLGGTEILGSLNAQPVRLFSNNVERARIISTGEVVVGATVPFAGDKFSSYASGTNIGIAGYGSGTGSTIYSQNTGGGTAMRGISTSATAFGLFASNTNANGTGILAAGNNAGASYLVAGSGGAFTGATTGIWGRTTGATATGGIFSGNASGATGIVGGSGMAAVGTNFGVVGFSSSAVAGVARTGGYFDTGSGQSYAYVGFRTAGNVSRKIEGNGTVNTVVKDLDDKLVVLSCPEAPENLFQDFGQGQLQNGRSHIDLDPIFAKNIIVNEKHPLRVFVQLKGDCNGVFVSNENGSGFDIIELKGGNSNAKFTYFITANRADEMIGGILAPYSAERFAPAMGPQATVNIESKEIVAEELMPKDQKSKK